MFYYCTSLQTIYVGSGWSTAAVTDPDDMFSGCTSLVGGQGTAYDSNHVDDAYAHIDGGSSNPGYFTDADAVVAYTCYTPDNTTLTFYYDNQRRNRQGTTYDLNTGGTDTGWETAGTSPNVTRVVFDPSFADARPTTTYSWFYSMNNLQSITGMKEYLNTSEVTDMKRMFSSCASLQMLDLTSFNTAKVTDMSEMFSNCNEMTALDLSSFDTHNVTTMHAMFFRCAGLKTIYVGDGWSPQGASQMFEGCISLVGGEGTTYDSSHTGYDYAHVDGGTDNPGYLSVKKPYVVYNNGTLKFCFDMYRDTCPGTTYDLNNGSGSIMTAWYTDGSYKNVTSVVFDPSFADARPTTTGGWFMEMSKLSSITGMKEYLNTSEVEGATLMFYGCSSLESLDLSNFDTQKMTIMNSMFNGCSGLTSLDLSSFNTAKVTDMGYMFNACSNLKTILIGEGWSTESVRTSYLMFNGCTSLVGGAGTAYDAEHTDAAYAKADGGQSDPGYLTRLAAYTEYADGTLTFYFDGKRGQRSGQTYDLNRYTPKWFSDGTYKNVTSVVFDASFKEACPVSTREWFESMSNLESITGMTEYLNTSEVTDMAGMFFGCQKLTTLDLSNFDTQQVTDMSSMFGGCSALTTIYVGDKWSTASVTLSYYMFYSCDNLVGGAGTTYDEAHIGADYAHVDGGADNPGYLTFKASLKGDVNLDGQVGIGDIVAITNVMAGIETNSAVVARADVNGDDQVGIGDIVAITNIMAGIE
jgi:surface protein